MLNINDVKEIMKSNYNIEEIKNSKKTNLTFPLILESINGEKIYYFMNYNEDTKELVFDLLLLNAPNSNKNEYYSLINEFTEKNLKGGAIYILDKDENNILLKYKYNLSLRKEFDFISYAKEIDWIINYIEKMHLEFFAVLKHRISVF